MRRIPTADDAPIVLAKWTPEHVKILTMLLGQFRRVLVPQQVGPLRRCLRFQPGSVVRKRTIDWLRVTFACAKLKANSRADTPWCEVCGFHKCGKGRRACHVCRKEASRA